MKVLLTGSTGYVGHQLAIELASKNFIVHALVRNLKSSKIPKHKNIRVFEGDVCDYESIVRAIGGCQYVFHAAAFTNLKCKKIDNFYNTNVMGTENLLKASLKNKVKKVVYTSTLSVFGPSFKNVPITEEQPRLASYSNDYELTKSMSEEVVYKYVKKGLPCVILNLSKVYGPGLKTFSNGVNKLILKIIKNDFLIVPSKLDVNSNYVYINDVVSAHLLAMKHGTNGEKYIIGGENLNYDGLFNSIKNLTKSKIRIIKIDYGFLRMCFSLINILKVAIGAPATITAKVLDSLFTNRMSTSKKAITDLGYRPTPLNLALTQTINYLKQ